MANDVSGLKPAPLPMHKKVDAAAADQKLHEVAQLYEEQFLREMVKAMRGTVPEGGLIKVSQGEQLYREQLDQNYTEKWSKQGGLGLQEMIYQQLVEKFGAKMGLGQAAVKPQGPLPLEAQAHFRSLVRASSAGAGLGLQLERQPVPQLENSPVSRPPTPLQNAWDGKLLGVHEINPNEYVIQIGHDNGLSSKTVFRGTLAPELRQPSGDSTIKAGAPLGLLSPEAQSFFWQVQTDGLKTRNPTISE
jgi:flagellar protein FlgJ